MALHVLLKKTHTQIVIFSSSDNWNLLAIIPHPECIPAGLLAGNPDGTGMLIFSAESFLWAFRRRMVVGPNY